MNVRDAELVERAWCFEAPIRGDSYNVLCFRSIDECARRARLDLFAEGACLPQDARTALVALYGDAP